MVGVGCPSAGQESTKICPNVAVNVGLGILIDGASAKFRQVT